MVWGISVRGSICSAEQVSSECGNRYLALFWLLFGQFEWNERKNRCLAWSVNDTRGYKLQDIINNIVTCTEKSVLTNTKELTGED